MRSTAQGIDWGSLPEHTRYYHLISKSHLYTTVCWYKYMSLNICYINRRCSVQSNPGPPAPTVEFQSVHDPVISEMRYRFLLMSESKIHVSPPAKTFLPGMSRPVAELIAENTSFCIYSLVRLVRSWVMAGRQEVSPVICQIVLSCSTWVTVGMDSP